MDKGSKQYAIDLDKTDKLAPFRDEFYLLKDNKKVPPQKRYQVHLQKPYNSVRIS